ncbi:hypothetical protein [Kistimonas asteriae]|uniref:hypothetical protein n=1 Tax=Kistimonas asteriae TaxID=517724 RepID=UPI001BAC6462|nr:hypothetical protein [Kistimonas asteriae]
MRLVDLLWSVIKNRPETAERWPAWGEVTEKPGLDYVLMDFGTVSVNSRYYQPNPFGSSPVILVVELLINNSWGEPGWYYSQGVDTGTGTKATQSGTYSSVIVQTGGHALTNKPARSGTPNNTITTAFRGTASCRVHVWRVAT